MHTHAYRYIHMHNVQPAQKTLDTHARTARARATGCKAEPASKRHLPTPDREAELPKIQLWPLEATPWLSAPRPLAGSGAWVPQALKHHGGTRKSDPSRVIRYVTCSVHIEHALKYICIHIASHKLRYIRTLQYIAIHA